MASDYSGTKVCTRTKVYLSTYGGPDTRSHVHVRVKGRTVHTHQGLCLFARAAFTVSTECVFRKFHKRKRSVRCTSPVCASRTGEKTSENDKVTPVVAVKTTLAVGLDKSNDNKKQAGQRKHGPFDCVIHLSPHHNETSIYTIIMHVLTSRVERKSMQ